MTQDKKRPPNRLINEKSPYLLQHAYNPVNWYTWSDEAFAKAQKEEKPIFLSIGYSACHWCHVMERESFEDDEVAEILNKHFISIKVDKEERPEVDAIYMKVCQMMTGSGGWPLTILMTPEQKPFYACTYLPKRSTQHMIGLINLLEATNRIWKTEPEKLIRSGDEIADVLAKEYQTQYATESPGEHILEEAVEYFKYAFDSRYGGFESAPKFPVPHNLLFLTQYSTFQDDSGIQEIVERTLESMYRGGIFDHVGGGFSRYATDDRWLVPHFEKMLYDNALLVMAYLEAYEAMKHPLYLEVVERTLSYVMREMTQEEGGFFSAQDADSEGAEGKYYVLSPEEVIQVLGQEAGEEFNAYYNITKKGNFEGKNIPNLIGTKDLRIGDETLEGWRKQIYQYRLDRTKLNKDDKILTSWNALMIAAFARAYAVLQKEEYLEVAKKAYGFIQDKLRNKDGRLLIRYRDGESIGLANIDDYSFLLLAQLNLYEATFDLCYLQEAKTNADEMISLFWDTEAGGFFFYGTDARQLIARPKETYDGAVPSGNSVAGYTLLKLNQMLEDERIQRISEKQVNFLASVMKEHPAGHSFGLSAMLLELYSIKKLLCVVWDKQEYKKILSQVHVKCNPNLVTMVKTMENEEELEAIAGYTKTYKMMGGQSTFYLCTDKHCMPGVSGTEHISSIL